MGSYNSFHINDNRTIYGESYEIPVGVGYHEGHDKILYGIDIPWMGQIWAGSKEELSQWLAALQTQVETLSEPECKHCGRTQGIGPCLSSAQTAEPFRDDWECFWPGCMTNIDDMRH